MSVSLRELTVADAAVLRNISIATFTETFADSNSAADMALYIRQRFSEDQLTKELANPESFFYTAEVQGQTVGYLKLNTGGAQTEPQQENALEIERIYVLGTHHGHGVGQALYQHALTIANQREASYIWLGCGSTTTGRYGSTRRTGSPPSGSTFSVSVMTSKQTSS